MEVARQLSFSKASQNLFITQPAVSNHIKALEDYYKTALFIRQNNSISLTKAGSILYESLKKAFDHQKNLELEIAQVSKNFEPQIHLLLGASTTIALYVIPPVLSSYLRKNPSFNVTLLNRNTEKIIEALTNNEIDLGIVESPKKENAFDYTPFLTDEVIPVCSSKSFLKKKREVILNELRNIPIAIRERGSGTLEVLTSELEKKGIALSDLHILIRLGGTEGLKNFLLADECLGFLPRRSVLKELRSGDLVEVKIPDLSIQRKFQFVQRKGQKNDPVYKEFIRYARSYYNK